MAKKHKYDYFDAYEELSDLAVQEASVLVRAMENFTDAAALRAVLDEAHALEHAGDMINHDIYKHVGNDFMPPFDREDIVALAGALDEILDEIEDVLQYFYMFDIHQIPEDALRFATLIRKSCKAVDAAMEDFLQEVEELQAAGHSGLRQRGRGRRAVRGGHPQPACEPRRRAHARAEVVAPVRLHGELLRRLRAHRRPHEHDSVEEYVGSGSGNRYTYVGAALAPPFLHWRTFWLGSADRGRPLRGCLQAKRRACSVRGDGRRISVQDFSLERVCLGDSCRILR